MVITYHGAQMVKLTSGELTLVFNPISKEAKLKNTPKFGADIALISRNLPEFNGVEQLSRKDKKPFVIDGPGEYEIQKAFVQGIGVKSAYKKEGINTIYVVKLEDINILFLGALSDEKIDFSFLEDVDDIDIVFVPIGDEGVLESAAAHKLAVSLEPKIIIPVHYEYIGKKGALESFLKEAGREDVEAVDKLSIKKKDLEGKSAELVVLSVK